MDYTNKDALIWLNAINFSNNKIINLKNKIDLKEIFDFDKEKFVKDGILSHKDALKIKSTMDFNKLSSYKEFYDSIGCKIITIYDDNYPKRLRDIEDAPQILYVRGEITDDDFYSLAIVGSRKLSDYGRESASFIAREIASLGITVVSGMADGADGIAHRESLKAGGRTIAVMGTGIDVIYPSKNKDLYYDIPSHGAVITEFPLHTKGVPYNFPRRNRIISGLSLGVVVVEAKERSGTLITASYAGEQGRDVFAIPGNINSIYSKGTNKLIQDGAHLIMSADDIIEEINELRLRSENSKNEVNEVNNINALQAMIINVLSEGEASIDTLLQKTGLNISELQVSLTELELMDLVISTRRGTYIKKLM